MKYQVFSIFSGQRARLQKMRLSEEVGKHASCRTLPFIYSHSGKFLIGRPEEKQAQPEQKPLRNNIMQIVRNVMVALLVTALVACAWLRPLDAPAAKQADAGMKRALISFAAARTLNAFISVAQGTEASIQPLGVGVTLTPGQALRPIHDLVEQFSTLMLAASVVFGVQKILISIGSNSLLSLALTMVAFGWVWCYFRQLRPSTLLSRLLVILLMLRFAIPVVTLGADVMWQKYLAADYAVSQGSISSTSGQVDKLSPSIFEVSESQGMLEKMKGWLSKNADVKVHFANLKAAAEQATEHIVKLIVIFVLQTLVRPLLLLWALYGVARRAFEWPGPMPAGAARA